RGVLDHDDGCGEAGGRGPQARPLKARRGASRGAVRRPAGGSRRGLGSYFDGRKFDRTVAATSSSNRTRTSCATIPRIRGNKLGDQASQLMPRCAKAWKIPFIATYACTHTFDR